MEKEKRLKFACYNVGATMSVVAYLSPVLFITFRLLYDISYSLLGTLVLINFVTQLTIDLVFSFFSHKFNISKTVKAIPVISAIGIFIYALSPFLFPQNVYLGLAIGTVIFSAASGLGEVLISPVIAAIPSDDPDREMSKLHSVYAWGVVFVTLIMTAFLLFVGVKNWYILALLFTLVPITSACLFYGCKIPDIKTPEHTGDALGYLKSKTVWLHIFAIFLGGAAECTMAQWSSGYLETVFSIPKVFGDIFGVALFSALLGLGRTLYAKFGKNITKILVLGAIGATVCYFTVAVCDIAWIGLIACALTGFCTSMLWPGNLVVASERFAKGGVFIYALMAAGGDLGASVSPQLVGVITDTVIANPFAKTIASALNISTEQLGMKSGMLCSMLFSLVAVFVYLYIHKKSKQAMKN